MALYESGKLDIVADLGASDLMRLQQSPELKTFEYLKVVYLGFVLDQGLAADVHVRRAIAQAIDKTKFAQILNGGQTPATGFIPSPMMGYLKDGGLRFSPEQARAELKKSKNLGDKTLHLLVSSFEKPQTVSQYLQAELKKNLGLEIKIESFENKTFRAQADLKKRPLFLLSWGADYPDPDNFYSVLLSDSGNNRMNFISKAFDQKVVQARASTKMKERTQLYSQVDRQITQDEVVLVPLYYEPNQVLIKSRIKGVVINPLNYLYLNRVEILDLKNP